MTISREESNTGALPLEVPCACSLTRVYRSGARERARKESECHSQGFHKGEAAKRRDDSKRLHGRVNKSLSMYFVDFSCLNMRKWYNIWLKGLVAVFDASLRPPPRKLVRNNYL